MQRRLMAALALAASWSPAALQAATPVLGTPQSSVSVQGSAGSLGSMVSCGDSVNGSVSAAYGCMAGGAAHLALVAAAAGFGAVHASVLAQGSSSTTFGSSGQANAYFSDSFALHGPANTSGVLHGSFAISGGLDVTVSGPASPATAALASYSVQASLSGWNGASDGNVFEATTGVATSSNSNGQILLVNAPVSFDSDGWAVFSISVLAQLHAEGTARGHQTPFLPGEYRADASFGNTIYWGGISSITVGGAPLASYDYLASASGVDYRLSTEFAGAPVPEPGRLALAGIGLAALAAVRGRRTRPA